MQLPNGPGSCFAKRLLITLSPLAAGMGWGTTFLRASSFQVMGLGGVKPKRFYTFCVFLQKRPSGKSLLHRPMAFGLRQTPLVLDFLGKEYCFYLFVCLVSCFFFKKYILKLLVWLHQVVVSACGIQSPDQGQNRVPLYREPGFAAIGLPGKSLVCFLIYRQSRFSTSAYYYLKMKDLQELNYKRHVPT